MKSKSKQAKHQNLAKARLKNPNHSKSMESIDVNVSFNTAMLDSPSDTSENSDITPDHLNSEPATDSDATNATSSENEYFDPNFQPLQDKLMVAPFSFIQKLMKMVCCPICQKQGVIVPSVTNICGFFNDINFLCRCKHSFSVSNFADESINDALVRNLVRIILILSV